MSQSLETSLNLTIFTDVLVCCLPLLDVAVEQKQRDQTWGTQRHVVDLLGVLDCVGIEDILVFLRVLDVIGFELNEISEHLFLLLGSPRFLLQRLRNERIVNVLFFRTLQPPVLNPVSFGQLFLPVEIQLRLSTWVLHSDVVESFLRLGERRCSLHEAVVVAEHGLDQVRLALPVEGREDGGLRIPLAGHLRVRLGIEVVAPSILVSSSG